MVADFFISRSGADEGGGLWIAQTLTDAGYKVRIQDWHIVAGMNFKVQMGVEIKECERTLPVLSPAYQGSADCTLEWSTASTYGPGRLIPIRIADVEDDTVLRSLVYVDLRKLDEERARIKLLVDIRKAYSREGKYGRDTERRDRVPFPATSPPIVRAGVDAQKAERVAYLCNRGEQEDSLDQIIKRSVERSRPLICVVHGPEVERADKFAERLHTFSVPKIQSIDVNRERVDNVPVNWPTITSRTAKESFRQSLETEAGRALGRYMSDSAPIVVRTNVLTADWCRELAWPLVNEFVAYWNDFQVNPNRLFLVCLAVRHARARDGFFRNKKDRAANAAMQAALTRLAGERPTRCHVLPELPAVERPEAEKWTELDEVQEVRACTYDEIAGIYRRHADVDALTMQDLAPELRDLLLT